MLFYFASSVTEIGNQVKFILLCILGGFAVALAVTYYCKEIAGKSVRLLLEEKAFDEKSAKSLSELGLKNVKFHKSRIEKSNPQKKICVKVCGEDGTERYYIAESEKHRAERTYISKENSLGMTAVSILIVAIVMGLTVFVGDDVIEKIDKAVSEAKSSDIGGSKTDDGGFTYDTDDNGHVNDGSEDSRYDENNDSDKKSDENDENGEAVTEGNKEDENE